MWIPIPSHPCSMGISFSPSATQVILPHFVTALIDQPQVSGGSLDESSTPRITWEHLPDFRVNPHTLHLIRTPPIAHLPHPGRREGCLDRWASEGETMVTT